MKVSIVTICYNSGKTLEKTIQSIASQSYNNIEYIVVDGGSKDNTVDIIKKYNDVVSQWVSEPDNGLYDALNKGIRMATGEVVGVLHSDDIFYDEHVIQKVADGFISNGTDAVFADIQFVRHENLNKVIRHYSSKKWHPGRFVWGFMPAHTSFFVKKSKYEELGYYQTDYKIAADYELLIRFLNKNKVSYTYLPMVTTKMLIGGASTSGIKSVIILNKEIKRGCKENGLYTNNFMLYSKYFTKIFEFIKK